jgi:hypothetical protein
LERTKSVPLIAARLTDRRLPTRVNKKTIIVKLLPTGMKDLAREHDTIAAQE